MLSPEERARVHAAAPRRVQGTRRATALDRRVPARTTTRSRRSITMEDALGANGAPHPQLVANDMVATVDDPELGRDHAGRRADPPARHAGRDPGAAAAARPAQRRDLRRARLLRPPRSRRITGRRRLMHALEGVRARRLRPVPRRAVRPDDHRRPRRRRDQGRAGHRRRHAHGRQAVLRLPARQARHRARPQDPSAGTRSRSSSSSGPTSCTTT